MIDAIHDFDMSSLAANAAVELDLLINGENTDLKSVKILGERLESTLEPTSPSPTSPHSPLLDTATETILGQALVASCDQTTVESLESLTQKTLKIAKELSSAKSTSVSKELEWARAFCLALSQSAASYQQLMFNARIPHPNRR